MQNVHFSPPQLSPLFGVNVSTIKRWIDRGMLQSERTPGGHRRVPQAALHQFIERYPSQAAKSYVLNRLVKQGSAVDDWQRYYDALYRRDSQAAVMILESAYLRTRKLVDVLDDYIAPTLREIGQRWQRQQITVYDEHRMSFFIRTHLLHLNAFIPEPKPGAPLAILACAPGDYHELPLQMLALVFKRCGWRTEILGTNTPAEEMIFAAKRLNPAMLAITKTYQAPVGQNMLQRIRRFANPRQLPVVYGGNGWVGRQPSGPKKFVSLTDFSVFIRQLKPRRTSAHANRG